jgi:hypothetical protein
MELITQAKQTTRLKDCHSNKILDTLAKGLMILGIRGDLIPTAPELNYMVKMLQNDFGNLPIGELDLAFELMAKNKLDENPETYQNFSVLYLSRMLGGYARFVRVNYVEPKVELKQIEQPKVEDNELIEFAYECYKKNNNKRFDNIFMALDIFKHILKNNLMQFNYSEIYTLTLNELKLRILDRESKNRINEIIKDEDAMENMCRRMAVKIYFDSLNQ